MKPCLFLLSLLGLMFSSLPVWSASDETLTFGRFGPVTLYRQMPHPSLARAVLLKGEHHFDGNYQAMAEMILREATITGQGGVEH